MLPPNKLNPGILDDRGYNQVYAPTKALHLRTGRRCDAVLQQMNLGQTKSILELGCGTGEMSYLMASRTTASVVGVDLCQPFIDQANTAYHLKNLSFRHYDLNSKTWETDLGRQFDYVVGNGILHHLYHELDVVLPRLKQILAPGGKLVFWEPNLANPYVYLIFSYEFLRKAAKLEPAEMAFTSRFMRKKLEKAGFDQISVTCRDFLLPNTPEWLITPVIKVGNVLEQLPGARCLAQSLFISAERL